MGKAFEDGSLNFPKSANLPGCPIQLLHYFLVGDEIFALKPYLLRPYPGKNIVEENSTFNYRLSGARRVIENAFGIMAARWRIFRSPIQAKVETVEKITKAAVCLHNYLRQTEGAVYCPTGFVDSFDSSGKILPGYWRSVVKDDNRGAFSDLSLPRGSRYSSTAMQVREAKKSYVNSEEGAVSWQLGDLFNKEMSFKREETKSQSMHNF